MNYLIDSVIYFFFIFLKMKTKNRLLYLLFILIVIFSSLFQIDVFELNINTVSFVLLSFSLLAFFSEENDYELFYTMSFYLILGNLSSQIITYLLFTLQNVDKTLIDFILKNSITIYITSRIAITIVLLLVSIFGFRNIFKIKFKLIEVFPILVLSSTFLFICIILSKMLFGQWILATDILVLDIALFSITILVNILFHYYSEYKLKIFTNDKDKITLENRLISQKEMIEIHEELIHFKHDIKHTYRYIEDLLKLGDIESALSIIEEQHNMSILNINVITTDCPIFNMIIRDYKNMAISRKIDMKLLANITSDIHVNQLTFNSLLCNCLDNAFENTGDGGMVEINTIIDNSSISIEICNSINLNINNNKDPKYHGKGLTNVKNYIRKLNGSFELTIDESATIKFVLPNIITPN
ncbi:MAG: GHKL domain-containing protein [Bacilli bacterium]